MKKVCGYDVNGWCDSIARNRGEAPDTDDFVVVEGAVMSSVVQVGDAGEERWIGGWQAGMAPHGLGKCWGEIGRSERRIGVRQCIYKTTDTEAVAAAFSGLCAGSRHAVAAIDDIPATTEDVRDLLLKGLWKAGVVSGLLVWRPVLAALYGIEHYAFDEEQEIGVICHADEGFSIQKLKITKAEDRTSILGPERREAGRTIASCWGYGALTEAMGKLALGEPPHAEVVRSEKTGWQVRDCQTGTWPDFDITAKKVNLGDCDTVLFETLCNGSPRDRLRQKMEELFSDRLKVIPQRGITEAAYLAALRFSKGEPVYFDFLPQISTIIWSEAAARNHDLVEKKALPAGKPYRTGEPAEFGISAGEERISVYLNKENSKGPRKASVPVAAALDRVNLSIEQRPAAGRAKIFLESPKRDFHYTIDWDKAAPVYVNEESQEYEDWESIIARLNRGKATIPNRVVLPCDIEMWDETRLARLLRVNDGKQNPDWDGMARQLSKRRDYIRYCISSDGEIPDEVDSSALESLESLTEQALADVSRRVSGSERPRNRSLKFLTWQFKRCPSEVCQYLLNAVEAERDGASHPFLQGSGVPDSRRLAYVLILQGLGRAGGDTEYEQAAIDLILSIPVENWFWRAEAACLAFLLSRSESAPQLLSEEDVKQIAKRVLIDFDSQKGTDYEEFFYAPFLLVGLLRWRLKEPGALVAGMDPRVSKLADCASAMAARVERAIQDMEDGKSGRRQRAANKYLKILKDALTELKGKGRNPDLLIDISKLRE